MWLTEEEAKTKWCTMARVNNLSHQAVAVNRTWGDKPDIACPCIASNCMMWRWATFFKDSKTGAAPMKPGAYAVGTAAECGYCGVAGKPDVILASD